MLYFILVMCVVLPTLYMIITGRTPDMKSLRKVPVLNKIEAQNQGRADMRKALDLAIVQNDYSAARQAIEEQFSYGANKKTDEMGYHTSDYNRSSSGRQDALEQLDMKMKRATRRAGNFEIDHVAKSMVTYEQSNNAPFPFDISKGQSSEYYFGGDEEIWDAYIRGGIEYINEVQTAKSRMVDRISTANGRKNLQNHVNRQIQLSMEANHQLQIERTQKASDLYDQAMERAIKEIEG